MADDTGLKLNADVSVQCPTCSTRPTWLRMREVQASGVATMKCDHCSRISLVGQWFKILALRPAQ